MEEFLYNSPEAIRAVLRESGGAVRKRWGQNFLVDPNHARIIARLILENTTRELFEIGPGFGAVTRFLLDGGRDLRVAEIDPLLADIVEKNFGNRLQLYRGDARDILAKLAVGRDLCGNLPYYISTELLLGSVRAGAQASVFLLQKEFAERACATTADSSLCVFLACFGQARVVHTVPAAAFYPKPEVVSAVLAFCAHKDGPRCSPSSLEELLRASFGMRRKMLRSAWKHSPVAERLFAAAEITGSDLSRRAEELPFDEFFELARKLEGVG